MESKKIDKRMDCKYGADCYQKNPFHLSKYKHSTKAKQDETPAKKRKLNNPPHTTTREKSPDLVGAPEDTLQAAANQSPKTESNQFIKINFLVDFPQDFYDFWNYCKSINDQSPSDAFSEANLRLVGAYDVLAGKLSEKADLSSDDYLLHWRYYFDPPELQTVLQGDNKTGYHIGYFYDTPNEPPSFLAENQGLKDGIFNKVGDNIFAAVYHYLEKQKKSGDPFKRVLYNKLQAGVKQRGEELKLVIIGHSDKIRERESKIITKTWNKLGLVVPYEKKTELGYRDLVMGDSDFRKLLDKLAKADPEQRTILLSELQPVLTYATIALDECDFGTGVKLGLNLLAHGIDSLNLTIRRYLVQSNQLLGRNEFALIAEAHLKNRKKSTNLSVL